MSDLDISRLQNRAHAKGYAAGVDAAREAVAATTVGFGIAVDAPVVVAYLAAIDALRGSE